MLVKEIFCDCGCVLKLVLWGGCGVFAQMNVGLAGFCHLVLCFLGFIVWGLGCVFWCLKASWCFTWNTTFLQQPICFTWNIVFALRCPKDVNVFHVKRRVGWLSCWWWFLRTLSLVVVEEVVFHVKHWFWILKLIQPLGKLIFINRQKIRKNMLSSLVFLTYRD